MRSLCLWQRAVMTTDEGDEVGHVNLLMGERRFVCGLDCSSVTQLQLWLTSASEIHRDPGHKNKHANPGSIYRKGPPFLWVCQRSNWLLSVLKDYVTLRKYGALLPICPTGNLSGLVEGRWHCLCVWIYYVNFKWPLSLPRLPGTKTYTCVMVDLCIFGWNLFPVNQCSSFSSVCLVCMYISLELVGFHTLPQTDHSSENENLPPRPAYTYWVIKKEKKTIMRFLRFWRTDSMYSRTDGGLLIY